MAEEPLTRVLLVDDDEDDYVMARKLFSRIRGGKFDVEWVSDYSAAREAVAGRRHDVYLLDYRLGEGTGLELLREAVAGGHPSPMILLTGQGDFDVDVEAMRAGAADFLNKGQITPELLERAVRHSIARKETERALRRAHDELEGRVAERTAELTEANAGLRQQIDERQQTEGRLRYQLGLTGTIGGNVSEGIFVLGTDGRVTYANETAGRMLGREGGELVAGDAHDVVHRGGACALSPECPLRDALRDGTTVRDNEDVFMREDGSRVPVIFSSSPIVSDGRVSGAVLTFRDLTERKEAEEALREQTEAVETINRVGQLLSAELDLHKLVQAVTDAATELTGARFGSFFYNVLNEEGASYMLYTLSGVLPEAFAHFPMPRATDLFGPTFRGEGVVRIADVHQDPRYGKNSPYFGMPEGHLPVVSYLAVPVASRSGEVMGGLFFGHPEPDFFTPRDEYITVGLTAQAAIAMDNARLFEQVGRERAQAESMARENERLYHEAKEANRLKDEFLATLSHELRTPLTAILGWARMLRAGQMDKHGADRALETIERNARVQSQLIEDILDVSRIVSGKLRLEVQPVDLTSVIEAAVDSVLPAAEARQIRLQRVLDSGASMVSGDPGRLQQVVWNLLTNAVKFTPKNGRVQVRLERINSHVEIVVADTGQGISPDVLPHVFERFRQADSSSTRTHGGLGLGLAIVRHLVEMHGGTVHAESGGEGAGATFTVRLPLIAMRSLDLSPPAGEGRVHPTASAGVPFDCPPELEGLHVLTVDDEDDTRLLVTAVLEQCGARVTAVSSAAEALAALEESRPDVLISDIGMPEEDGYSLIRKVRALPAERGGRTPAAALTAYARVEDRLKVLRAGFQIHLPKPVEPTELVTVVASLTGRTGKD